MSSMNFITSNQTLERLLAGNVSYCVPPFQRDYSWTEDEWDDLWQDIQVLFEPDGEASHYMGYLVLQSSKESHFDLIDGQQRMTTLSLLILSGLFYLKTQIEAKKDAEDHQKRLDHLQLTYIGYIDPASLVAIPKLTLNRHNNDYYQNSLVRLGYLPLRQLKPSVQLLRKAFLWFCDKMKERFEGQAESGKKCAEFLGLLSNKLFFTVITVTDELNAFKVFETLNARGVKLSSTDLLKNYLFSILTMNNSENIHNLELKGFEDRWDHIVSMLGSENFPDFLRIYWNSKNKSVRKSDLFKIIRRTIFKKEQAFSLLESLCEISEVYAALCDSNDERWNTEERDMLNLLSLFNARQTLSILLVSYHKFFKQDRDAFFKVLKALMTLSFRYNIICQLSLAEQERFYQNIAYTISLNELKNYKEILNELEKIYPDDKVFEGDFCYKTMDTCNNKNKNILRYIFFKMEKKLSGKDYNNDSNIYNIEHILPENSSEDWSYIPFDKQDRMIYRIGNMTLLETDKNRKIGNQNYDKKRSMYEQSTFSITNAIAKHYENWDETKLNARQKQLAKLAIQIWRIDFGAK